MTSLTILTLFLGLTTGSQTVALSVESPPEQVISRVELRLDGEVCGERERPPWLFRCDFGEELAPHRLEAVAYDAEGAEVARTGASANLTPRQAEAEMAVERDAEGRAEALRVVWDAVTAATPTSLLVSFDDVPLELPEEVPADGTLRLPLPEHDPRQIHFASAELTFPDGTAARADVAFGGALSDEVSSQSTGIPVIPVDGPVPTPDRAADGLAARRPGSPHGTTTPLRALAFESGEADVVAVVEASAAAELAALRERFRADGTGARESEAAAGLEAGDRFTLVDPTPRATTTHTGGDPYDVFQASPPRFASQGGLVWQLTHVFFPPSPDQHLADAVAMAGMQAAAGSRPRTVLLVLGPEARDDSRFTPAQVRRYLHRLRVPVAVWWLEREGRELDRRERRQASLDRAERQARKRAFAAAWGGVEEVTGFRDLVRSAERLRQRLGEQRVLWVDGLHLPTEIVARQEGAAAPVRLVGVESARGAEVVTAEEIELRPGEAVTEDLLAESGQLPGFDESGTGEAGAGEAGVSGTGAGDGTRPASREANPGQAVPAVADRGGPLLLEGAGLESFRDSLRIDLVEVEAVVTDRRGRPVPDLGPDDFEVLEDGRPVEVRHFAVMAPEEARVAAGGSAESGATSPEAATPPTPEGMAEPPHVVIYLDEDNMLAGERNRMLHRLEPLLSGLPEGARIQVLTQQGGLKPLLPFTRDRGAVRQALEQAAEGSGGARQRQRERWRALDRVLAAETDEEALRVAVLYASQRMAEVKTTVGHLASLVDTLAPLPGRKAIIYLGSGLQILAGREAFQVRDPGANFGRSGHPALRAGEFDATPLYKELAARASAARVAFYGVDAGGVRGAASFDVERMESFPVQLDADIAENVARPLQLMAQATGGLAITGTNRIEPEIARVAADFSRHYVLGFSPSASAANEAADEAGGIHAIEVRVRRPGLRVRHRTSYLHRDPDQRLTDAVTAALSLPREAVAADTAGSDGPTLAFGTPQRLGDGTFRVPVEVRIPFSEMVLVPSGSRWVNDLEVFVAVASPDGATSPVRRAPVTVDLSTAAARAARGDYTVTVPLRMAAGEHRVAVGVRDAVTGVETVTAADTDVQAPPSPLQIRVAERREGGDDDAPVAGAALLAATSPADRHMLARNGATGSRLVPTQPPHPFKAGLRPGPRELGPASAGTASAGTGSTEAP